MAYYLGLKTDGITLDRAIFSAESDPIFATHGDQWNAVVGPFRTKRAAVFMRDYGQGNPHCRTVGEAERLARLADPRVDHRSPATRAKSRRWAQAAR